MTALALLAALAAGVWLGRRWARAEQRVAASIDAALSGDGALSALDDHWPRRPREETP